MASSNLGDRRKYNVDSLGTDRGGGDEGGENVRLDEHECTIKIMVRM